MFYSTPDSSPKPITTCCSVLPPEIVMHDAYSDGHFRRMKITRKASDVAENLQFLSSCSVLPPEIVMHNDAYIGGRSENNSKCVVHDELGWKYQTTRYILPHHWLYEWFFCGICSVLSWSPSVSWLVFNGTFSTANRLYHARGVWNISHMARGQDKHHKTMKQLYIKPRKS